MAAILAITPHAYGESELALNQTLETFVTKKYGHQYSVVLGDGFWAKAGSDVTVTVGNGLLQMLSGVVKIEPGRQPDELVPYSGGAATDNVLVEVGKNVDLPNPTNYYAVDGIGIREEDDQPCYISLWGRMVDPRYKDNLFMGRKVGEFQLAKCNVRPEKQFLKGKDVSVGELDLAGGFVRSVRVCQYGGPIGGGIDAGELKGIRILPAIVSRSGDVIPKDLKPEEQPTLVQPHCPKDVILANNPTGASGWDHWVSCPADQVVTGLQVYHREKQITALDVRCKRVGWLTAPKEPVRDLLGY